jgi:hypothetical protein
MVVGYFEFPKLSPSSEVTRGSSGSCGLNVTVFLSRMRILRHTGVKDGLLTKAS